jgi:hypothetical protein
VKLTAKIIFGVSIGIIIIFAIMIATVLMVRVNTMSNMEGEFLDIAHEIRMTDKSNPWFGMNCNEMLDFSTSGSYNKMQDSMHFEFQEHYLLQCP